MAIEEAVQLYRVLTALRPDAFGPNLASSLNNLSGCLSSLGRQDEALAAVKEAVGTLAPYFVAHSDAFREWMGTLVGTYRSLVEQAGGEVALDLDPILRMLETKRS